MFTRSAVGLLLSTLASLSHAALITENYQIVLTDAQDIYSAGHVFHISATYDSAGVAAHYYLDGDNHIAEFGAGDDLDDWTDICDPCANDESLSDAVIIISGLLPPQAPWRPVTSFIRTTLTLTRTSSVGCSTSRRTRFLSGYSTTAPRRRTFHSTSTSSTLCSTGIWPPRARRQWRSSTLPRTSCSRQWSPSRAPSR